MPTLPLYDTSAHPDGWHHVSAPGGYEWWHAEAEDPATGTRLVVDLLDGDPLSRAYRRAYLRYRRRPTRVAPPVPRDFPCVRVRLYEHGRTIWRVTAPQAPGAVRASPARLDVEVGPCAIQHAGSGEPVGSLRLSINALVVPKALRFTAGLLFEPLDARAAEMREVARDGSSAVHFGLMSSSRYTVTGTFRDGGPGDVRRFAGGGEYRHYFGTGPLGRRKIQP